MNIYKIDPRVSLRGDFEFKQCAFDYLDQVTYEIPNELYLFEKNGVMKEKTTKQTFIKQEDGNYKAFDENLDVFIKGTDLIPVTKEEYLDFYEKYIYDEEQYELYKYHVFKALRSAYLISKQDQSFRGNYNLLLLKNNLPVTEE